MKNKQEILDQIKKRKEYISINLIENNFKSLQTEINDKVNLYRKLNGIENSYIYRYGVYKFGLDRGHKDHLDYIDNEYFKLIEAVTTKYKLNKYYKSLKIIGSCNLEKDKIYIENPRYDVLYIQNASYKDLYKFINNSIRIIKSWEINKKY